MITPEAKTKKARFADQVQNVLFCNFCIKQGLFVSFYAVLQALKCCFLQFY
jgi:hypothetical protein